MNAIRRALNAIAGNNDEYVIKSGLLRLVALVGGAVLAKVSFDLSYAYGATMSQEGAYACGAISILSSFMLAIWFGAFESLKDLDAKGLIKGFTTVGLCLVAWDALTNSMTASFQRETDMSAAKMTRAVVADTGASLKELEATEKRLVARGERLDADMDKLVNIKVGDWAVAVRPSSPTELQGQIDAKKLERDNEAARGGCKARCEARQNELAHLIALQAKAKEIEDNHNDHQRVLTALANVRNKKATAQTEVVSNMSGAEFQAVKAGAWAAALSGDFSRAPQAGLIEWIKDFLGTMQCLAIMLGAQAFLGIALLTKAQIRSLRDIGTRSPAAPVGEPVRQSQPHTDQTRAYPFPSGIPSEPLVVHTVETVKDETLRKWALSDEVRAMLGQGQLKAA